MRSGRIVSLLTVSLLVAACGDPAPGEGVEKKPSTRVMPEVVSAAEAIQIAHVSTIDLHTMDEAEYEKVIPQGPHCTFLYSAEGGPVLAAGMKGGTAAGVVKIHGKLVELEADNVTSYDALSSSGARFSTDKLRVHLIPDPDEDFAQDDGRMQREADAVLEIGQQLKVGYRGWYVCGRADEVAPRQ